MSLENLSLGYFRDRRLEKGGAVLLERMVVRQSICLRRLSEGSRAREVGFGRFLANDRVTVERLIEGWSEQTRTAVAGRHVLAIQDTSEINFRTTQDRQRGLGEIGKGVGRGVLVHAMVAVDATDGNCLGLVAGSVYTRKGRIKTRHPKRLLEDKESRRWIDTAAASKAVLTAAALVTVVADRESDIYAEWAMLPGDNFHLLTRVMHDLCVAGGGTLRSVAAHWPFVATRTVDLLTTHKRVARQAELSLRFGAVEVLRPSGVGMAQLPKTVPLRFIEVIERTPPEGVEPVHWRLLTTHEVTDVAAAWQIVDWYRRRWTIEQLFRLMKSHGLRIEDSQLAGADALIKLAAIATKAAAQPGMLFVGVAQLIVGALALAEGIEGQHHVAEAGQRLARLLISVVGFAVQAVAHLEENGGEGRWRAGGQIEVGRDVHAGAALIGEELDAITDRQRDKRTK